MNETRRIDTASKRRLKMWIRLIAATRAAENELREFLRTRHDTTLPRFDVMAALYRCPDGTSMSELSRMLLVSNGNATAVVDRLEADGLVRRTPSASDRRTVIVALTREGILRFERMAADHERAVAEHFAHLSDADVETLTAILKRMGRRT